MKPKTGSENASGEHRSGRSLLLAWLTGFAFTRIYLHTRFFAIPLQVVGHFIGIGVILLLFGTILKKDLLGYELYFAHMSIGLVVWLFFSYSVNDCANATVRWQNILRFERPPLLAEPVNALFRNGLIFLVDLVIVYGIILALVPVGYHWIWFVPLSIAVIAAFTLSCAAMAFVLALRFKDSQQVMTMALLVLLMVTPIIWTPDFFGRHAYLLNFNPLHALIESLRAPLLGYAPSAVLLIHAIGITLVTSVLAGISLKTAEKRVAYWL